MRTNHILLTITCVRLAAQVTPVAFSESKDVVATFSSSGPITLPAAHLQLNISYPSGRKERGDLAVVQDPQTSHYLWRYEALHSAAEKGSFLDAFKSGRDVPYADSATLVDFIF